MRQGIITYDDEWIHAHTKGYKHWGRLCKEYNEAHGTSILPNTFKAHCNRELSLNNHYTEEQIVWLKENFPKLGRVKTAEEFNKLYGTDKTPGAIKNYCLRMGVKCSDERRRQIPIENTGRYHKVGTIRPFQNGEPYIKTEKGWVRVKKLVYGEVPKGYNIVHLDGDVNNCDRENLYAVKRQVAARMTKNNLWSKVDVVTKTGIMCCELECLLDEGERE